MGCGGDLPPALPLVPAAQPRFCVVKAALGASGGAGGDRVSWVGWCPLTLLGGRGVGMSVDHGVTPSLVSLLLGTGTAGDGTLAVHGAAGGTSSPHPPTDPCLWSWTGTVVPRLGAPGNGQPLQTTWGSTRCVTCTQEPEGGCGAPWQGHSPTGDMWVMPSCGAVASEDRGLAVSRIALQQGCLLPPWQCCWHLTGHHGAQFHSPAGSRGARAPPEGTAPGPVPGLGASPF